MTSTPSLPRTTLLLVIAGVGALALAGCGGDAAGGSAAPTTAASSLPGGGASTGQSQGPGGGRAPGVSGTIAAVDGTTLQVQSPSEQTAVDYTSTTKITAQVKTPSSTLAVGDCVSVRTASDGTAPSTSPTAANGGTAPTGPIAASTVTIVSTDGCDSAAAGGGFPGGGGGLPGGGVPPSGAPTGLPSDAPSGRPSGGFPGGGRFGGFGAMGEVTEVSTGTFTITATTPRFGGNGTATPNPTATPTSAPVTVTYTDDTTFLTTRSAKATSIEVGGCVRATGTTDDTGKLTATSLVLSQPVDGACTTGVRGG